MVYMPSTWSLFVFVGAVAAGMWLGRILLRGAWNCMVLVQTMSVRQSNVVLLQQTVDGDPGFRDNGSRALRRTEPTDADAH